MTAPVRCPRHPDAELVPVIDRHAPVSCPECSARYCLTCGQPAPEAWQSGRCDGCYRDLRHRTEAERRRAEQARWDRLTAARDAAVAAADVAEAQTREWRHKYDVLLREHDAATTELAEAVAARDLLADSLRKMTEKSDHWEARARVAEAKRALDGGEVT